ncbi:MAG TPA: hypothetical protein VHR66_17820 [Gemmataceae bacterium]|jgi:hypothetical protein|nr:hypothetical protein [Gemmataceae bacterium]
MTFRLSLLALGLVGWLSASAIAADDVEVLARGPVHEAYAEPSEREPKPTPVIPKEPPKAIEELPPDQKPEGDNIQWMSGYWSWDDDKKDFLWVSGFWRNAPPGRSWVPGSWRKAGDGWQWTGGFWSTATAAKAEIQYLPQPPAPLDDAGPVTPAPSEAHVYVPGTWVYRERYVWRPGFWCEHRPNWIWTAAHYRWTPAGYVFIDGYWDYPLADRGVLFAPVYIAPAVYTAPAFVYTPAYVVREDCLFGAFFCRRGFGAYYFGDYFAPSYVNLGFTAWCGHVGVSIGIGFGRFYDPMFSYYRCGFRSDPFWGGGGITNLYAGRYRGDYMRPPTTLVQQTTVINNITKNTTVIKNSNLNNVTMVSSINDVAKSGRHNLQPVNDATRRQFAQTAQTNHETALRRAKTETELAARPGAGGRTATPRSATLDLPTSTVGAKNSIAKIDPATLAPPRPSNTRSQTSVAKGPSVGANPKVDLLPGAGGTAARGNPKPPITQPRGTAIKPANIDPSLQSPGTPKTLPKTLNTQTPAPKVTVPKTPVLPTPSAKLNTPTAARTIAPQAFKPPTPQPPVTIPKPPSVASVPRSVAAPVMPKVTAPTTLGPAATLSKPSTPAKKKDK